MKPVILKCNYQKCVCKALMKDTKDLNKWRDIP